MQSFDPSRWGILCCLNEEILEKIMYSVQNCHHVDGGINWRLCEKGGWIRTICKDGRSVANARAKTEQDKAAYRTTRALWTQGAYDVVNDMVAKAVRTSTFDGTESLPVTVQGNVGVLIKMFHRGCGDHVVCSVLDEYEISTYLKQYTHAMVFHGVIIMISTVNSDLMTVVPHYELQFMYNIMELDSTVTNRLHFSSAVLDILNLRLEYAKNPTGSVSASMDKSAMNMVPKIPVMNVDYYRDHDLAKATGMEGRIEDDRVPLQAFMAYVQCVVGDDPEGVNTAMLGADDWNGFYLGYSVFWQNGPVFCFIESSDSIFAFRTHQFPSLAPWPFQMELDYDCFF
jgi:hypothetical protein